MNREIPYYVKQNMPEYRLSLNVFSVFIRENTRQKKNTFWYFLRSAYKMGLISSDIDCGFQPVPSFVSRLLPEN